ncbi:deoxycytidylate deaminase [Liberiplasma polymorphum]|jgi:dCMP deaminase|uniref:deoxycytidylate deaminase n=1 Tax=Liberiplasma polymorphum TaxID=3374570 RepID=UPI00377484AF
MKRENYISWDEYFMGVARLSAMRSKDPNTQVGACIVSNKNRIVGIGYNGFPIGIDDDLYPWENEGEFLNTKYPYVVHAEPNAILNSTVSLDEATLYVTLFPCHECAKLIIQSGIKEIVYTENKYQDEDSAVASMRMLKDAGIKMRHMKHVKVKINHD